MLVAVLLVIIGGIVLSAGALPTWYGKVAFAIFVIALIALVTQGRALLHVG